MLTDWVLIARAARELEERLRGARVDDAGLLTDGRIGILFRSRGARVILAVDLFGSPPLVTLEDVELAIAIEPGFVRVLARSLHGTILAGASARKHDRLLRLTFTARSRFGVGERLELYLELVPRFGNAVLVKDGTIVAAFKEFSIAENPQRAVEAGMSYALPPLPKQVRTLVPDMQSFEPELEALFVYRRNGTLVQAYVGPLEGVGDSQLTREASLLSLFAELRVQDAQHAGGLRSAARRRAILKRLDEREQKLRAEVEGLAAKRRAIAQRDGLRAEGEEIFATLHRMEPQERDVAKERAAKLFAEYKRLAKSLPHVDARETAVLRSLEAVETLRWEAERAAPEDIEGVEAAVAELAPKRRSEVPARVPNRKRPPLEFRTALGSRILVGRSPNENAELTFRVARPNDLWFHAQRIPGAHVILSRDDRTIAPDEDIERAASLAAFHSRAKGATSVPVDYTPRKHVRKQRAAPPGLVWYTQARTVVVEPKATL
ncbi:MAG TPA: NFACT RNA binding domain-containing protein [Candidatus Cybelea sp.]|jgi:predicted ribosome quality control (RQC) complex YloA/Tae2 family protein|nr:NFACT RNA binding domain-containing protein [Candidatus Cybelea sp.]